MVFLETAAARDIFQPLKIFLYFYPFQQKDWKVSFTTYFGNGQIYIDLKFKSAPIILKRAKFFLNSSLHSSEL